MTADSANVSASILRFDHLPMQGETVYLEVKLARTGAILGHMAWEPPWRQYVFIPVPGARYTRSVLRAVNVKLARLMYTWGKRHPSSKRSQPTNAIDYKKPHVLGA